MIERQTRVLVVTPLGEGGRGGIDRMMDEIRPYGQSADFRDLSIRFWATRGSGRGLRAVGTFLFFLIRLITLCIFRRPDVVHINLSSGGSVIRKAAICAICWIFGARYVVHLHGSRFRQYWNLSGPVVGSLIAFIFTKADRVFVLGSVWHAFVLGKLPRLAGKLYILPNACGRGGPSEKPSTFVRLIFLGKVGERKGTFDLIEALALLPPELRWSAILAGDGETERASALICRHGLQDKVQVLGWVGPDRIRTLLGSSQVLVLPSYDENLPMSVIEAMAWGLAVIATPVGAVEDIIVHGERGLLVAPGDIPTLAARLKEVISSGPVRETLGRNARAFHEEHLSIDRYAAKLRAHWIEVAADRRGVARSSDLLTKESRMSLGWYLARIRSMSVPEIVFRLGEHVERSRLRRTSKVFPSPPPHLHLHPIPGLDESLLANVTPAFTRRLDLIVANILEGRFAALGAIWPDADPEDLFPERAWRIDPGTGRLWPGSEAFSFDIKYRRSGELGDIKYVWERNRLQSLQALAAAAALNHDRRALAALEEAIASWARHSPPYTGVGWNSGIEVALRSVSLILVYNFCSDRLSEQTKRLIMEILLTSRDFLERFPSKFSSANNHAMAEHLGLLLIEATVRTGDGDLQRARRQYEHIAHETALQILPDGAPAEQSPTYGAFTAEMVLLGNFVADTLALGVSEMVTQRLLAFADFVAAISAPSGPPPAIGDDDEGRVLTLDAATERGYVRSVAQAIQSRYDDLGACQDGEADELRNVLFGCSRLSPQPERRLRTFMQGGYSVITDRLAGRPVHLVIDHGPLGYLSIAAHGHADANAVVFSVEGRAVLCDPGTYLYHGGGAWRTWFRGTLAHNTLTLGGVDQSTIRGPFNWGHKARARLVERSDGADWRVRVAHDGYRSRFGVDHVRTLEAAPDGFALIDQLQPGPSPEEVSLVFQFAPGIVIKERKTALVFSRDGDELGRLSFDRPGDVTIREGESGMDGGWVSNRFGEMCAAPRVVWRGQLPSDGLRTSFELAPKRSGAVARLRVLDGLTSS